jgi:three-Cys-motif partner protein
VKRFTPAHAGAFFTLAQGGRDANHFPPTAFNLDSVKDINQGKCMTVNRFGGAWTREKLDVLQAYLQFYCKAMSAQPFELVYIDAFAGTGRCKIKNGAQGHQDIDGSARIALDLNPGFHKLRFIEKKKTHQAELQALIEKHPNGKRARMGRGSAQDLLPSLLIGYNWKKHRGVLFLDPFGLQCSYQLLQEIAATRALDVFFLVSLSGLYRQAAVNAAGIDEGKAAKLTNFLGTDGWREVIYTREQGDFFDGPLVSRDPGWRAILDFTTGRLRTVFPYVGEPSLMGLSNGAPLFALYFAVSNTSPTAIALAKRVSTDILSKLR